MPMAAIDGRKINFISYDDSYNPPKTVEQARELIESDRVLLIFQSLGTPPNRLRYFQWNSIDGLRERSHRSAMDERSGSQRGGASMREGDPDSDRTSTFTVYGPLGSCKR
jgi:Periplasmic binding protein